MKLKQALGCSLLFPLPPRLRKPTQTEAGTAHSEAFLAQTFLAQTLPHLDAIYADAFCLTGSQEEAADLVVAAYLRAFQGYEQFRRRYVFGCQQTQSTLAWLYANLHAAFCDGVLAQAGLHERRIGG